MASITPPRDPNTLSNYNSWKTKHTIADLAIDFKKQRLTGAVTLQLESLTEKESEEIVLDTSFLDIKDIALNGSKIKNWIVKDRSEPYGSPLSIKVPGVFNFPCSLTHGQKVELLRYVFRGTNQLCSLDLLKQDLAARDMRICANEANRWCSKRIYRSGRYWPCYNGQMHSTSMDGTSSDIQQEISVHVLPMSGYS